MLREIVEGKNYEKLNNELVYTNGEESFSVFSGEPKVVEIQAVYNDGESTFQEIVKNYKDVLFYLKKINKEHSTNFPTPNKKEVETLFKNIENI